MAVITGTNWNAYDASTMTAKEIYGRTLAALAENNDRIVGVTADLEKTTAIKFFADKFPERFYNVGIAEQNMMGIAAGLAKAGFIPFASTMAIFACMRAGEQVRTDIAYQNLPVKIIATHAGISFGHAGTTHHCTEDFAIMRAIPNMTVICPADGIETSKAVQACVDLPGPVYVRIGRGFEPPAYADDNYTYEIGKAITMHEGTDLTIITCGIGVLQAVNAAKTLAETDGLSVRVINMHNKAHRPRSHNERRSRHPPHTHRRGAQRAGRPGRRRGQRNSRIRQGLRIQKARHAGHLRHHWLC